MTNEQTEKLLLTDQDGNYYLFSREMLDQARVPAEHTEQIRAEMQKVAGEGDVVGFSSLVTTQAVGEESGGRSPMPTLTSSAIGEESGGAPPILTLPNLPPFFR